jgi:hypothetical protein
MTPSDFDRHFDLAVADAQQALVESGSLAPMYLVVDRIGHGQLVEADNSTPERKTASMELVRLLAVAADAELVLSRAEAWIVLGDYTPGLAPSRSDRRREVVAVLASARINDTIVSRMSLREIVRGDDGAAIGTTPISLPEGDGELEGPMSELLPKTPPTPAERRAARSRIERATKRLTRGKPAFAKH